MTVWWEGMTKQPPKGHLRNWKGEVWDGSDGTRGAHPNSRFTAPAENCPCISEEFFKGTGVPISAIIFGGRRAKTAPLVYQSRDWAHGVFVGATMASETTAAATGAVTRAEAEEAHKAAVTSYYACQEDWLGLPPETGEPAETVECDVLVLGGGHSGIHAALAAAEGGAKVAVVEKWAEDMRKVKGEDIGHINSQWLIDQGYGPYDVGEVTNEFVRRAGGRCNPEIGRAHV